MSENSKDLERRLVHLGIKLANLGSFTNKFLVENGVPNYKTFLDSLNNFLGNIFEGGECTWNGTIPKNRTIADAERELGQVYGILLADPRYLELVRAYELDHQEWIRKPTKNGGTLLTDILDVTEIEEQRFLHGISVPEGYTAEQYLDLINKILREGILPSKWGQHGGMALHVQPIYGSKKKSQTYGIVFFEVDLSGTPYKLYLDQGISDNTAERLLYCPQLRLPITLHVKTNTWETHGDGEFKDDIITIRDSLPKLLDAREIPFIIYNE